MSGFGGNANLTFDPTSEILCQLVSELHLLSERQVTTMLHQLREGGREGGMQGRKAVYEC